MKFHIITLFPGAFDSYLKESIIGRAQKSKKISLKFYNPRDFVKAKTFYKQTDGRPYGGGPGMVLLAEPILRAVAKARRAARGKTKILMLSPRGEQFTNESADKWSAKYTDVILICGRYEGIDARVKKILKADEVSVGPYVLTGGELPAMVVMDTIARRLPGVLGKAASVEERRVAGREVYTRPEVLVWPSSAKATKGKQKNYRVPKILLSGNHAKIDEWKKRS